MAKNYIQQLLGENEEIIFSTRQHWLILLRHILPEIISFIVIFGLITLIWVLWLPNPFVVFGYLALAIPLISLIRDIIIWRNHQYIVTNRRVIKTSGVFDKIVTDSSLEKVNDVKMNQSFMGRIFGYADIEIMTASEIGINRFSRIGSPIQFKTAMLNAKEQLEVSPQEILAQTNNIPKLIEQLDTLRQKNLITEEEFQKKKAELLSKL